MDKKTGIVGHSLYIVLLVMSFLILAALACTFDTNTAQKTPDETDIAKSVEQTLAAEQGFTIETPPTLDSSGLPTATTKSIGVQETIQSQQATLDAQSTLLAQPSPTVMAVQDTPSPTLPPASSEKSIPLADWKTSNMRQAPGCGTDTNGPPCWFGRGEELGLLLETPLLIDSTWSNPYLVFSHHYAFVQNATIYVKADGGWEVLWSFPDGQSSLWKPVQIDLSKYKGKEILLNFTVSGTAGTLYHAGSKNEWYIRDPQIDPNYSPY